MGIDTKISKPAIERLTAFDECVCGSFSPYFGERRLVKHSKNSGVVWLVVDYTLHAAAE